MNAIIGLKELRTNTEKYINAVKRGRSFTVVRRSRPVFRVIPEPSDEWGDDGVWETLLDFNKARKGGVPATEVLTTLQAIRGNKT